ncbi:hypothetical protein OG401_32290 [Kitasatospora purpeofusca]|uniref:hypothetical protein n=1 Tax=Kitasatospora purpeofusca TaxID=67352 RepID=UPI0022500844|nr:hypothetical protein [Kitasatospora purpeofusca]MCX4688923.1 hypothetical protein [Kitasatospora purpeofusca]
MYTVRPVTAEELLGAAELLGGLLADTVDGGSSLGFLAPLDPGAAADWGLSFGSRRTSGRRWSACIGGAEEGVHAEHRRPTTSRRGACSGGDRPA